MNFELSFIFPGSVGWNLSVRSQASSKFCAGVEISPGFYLGKASGNRQCLYHVVVVVMLIAMIRFEVVAVEFNISSAN